MEIIYFNKQLFQMSLIVALLFFPFVQSFGVLSTKENISITPPQRPTVCTSDGDCSVVSRDSGVNHLCFAFLCHPWDKYSEKAESLGFLSKCKKPSDCQGVNETCIRHPNRYLVAGLCMNDLSNVECETHEDCNEFKCVNKHCADPTFFTDLTEAQWAI